jgi:hypothetical protein
MKKFFTLLVFCAFVLTAKAQLLNYEPFNYTPDGTMGLHTQSGEAWVRLNTGDSILVTSGNYRIPGCLVQLEIKFRLMDLAQIIIKL